MKRLLPFIALLAPLLFVTCSKDDPAAPEPPPPPVKAPAFVMEWGTQGSGDGEFNGPYGVALDAAGNVYVADTGNNRIQKFNSDGTFVTKWGGAGTGDGEFSSPCGIACDGQGNVYVTDRFNHRVQKFTSDGAFVTRWGSQGTNEGEFEDPIGIACGTAGNVVVADMSVQVFSTDGVFVDAAANAAYGVAWDRQGYIYSVEYFQGAITRFDASDMTVLDTWKDWGTTESKFLHPAGMGFDSNRRILYVVDRDNARVQMLKPDGTFIDKWGGPGTGDGEFSGPTGVAVGSGSKVYVADTKNHRIQVFE